MVRISATLGALLCLLVLLAASAQGVAARATRVNATVLQSLERTLNRGMRAVGRYSGAYVVDLTTGQVLYAKNANAAALPASVEKLYTTIDRAAALRSLRPR